MTSLPVAVSPPCTLAVICATTACAATSLVASNTRLTESRIPSDREYADCENLRTIGAVWELSF